AGELRGDECPGHGPAPHALDQGQSPQETVAYRSREGVAHPETVDDLDRVSGDVGRFTVFVDSGAPLPTLENEPRGVAEAGGPPLLLVPDHDVGGSGGLGRKGRVLRRLVPKGRPPVEVEDRGS